MNKKIISVSLLLAGLFSFSCNPTPGQNPSSTPSPTQAGTTPVNDIKLTNMTEASCDQEGKLISKTGGVVSLTFYNYSGNTLKFYWLDFTGKRVIYNTLKTGGNYNISTYVTHPWLVVDEKDNCLGIYTSTAPGNASLTITSTGK